jgi:hypothetical protein
MPVIESDWPADIAIEVVSPLAYLKTQAAALSQLTKGVIEGKVSTATIATGGGPETEEKSTHTMLIVAPALEDAEIEILEIEHSGDLMYPCWLDARSLKFDGSLYGNFEPRQATYDELRKTVRAVLQSPETTGRIQSLLARINETKLK